MEMIWKDVVGYESIYQVSECGCVRSKDHLVPHSDGKDRIQKGRVLTYSTSRKGYFQVSLSLKSKRFHTGIHRLVALAFVPNPNNLPQVNHKDGNKQNNHKDNLEWVTNQDNQIHAVRNGLVSYNYGEKHHMCRLTNSQIIELKKKLSAGVTGVQLAKEYKMSQAAISQIKKGRTYKNIA